jgi:hypothetical protein
MSSLSVVLSKRCVQEGLVLKEEWLFSVHRRKISFSSVTGSTTFPDETRR